MSAALLDKARVEIKLGDYGVATAEALVDSSLVPQAQNYRRQSASRMLPLGREDIRERIPAADYHVSCKVDGEFTVLVYRDQQVLSVNPGGTVRTGLPWEEEAARLLSKAGVKEAMVAGELYVHCEERRPRVHDVATVARKPQSCDDLQRLRFAVFDVISLDGLAGGTFSDTWQIIERIFGSGDLVQPVETKVVHGADAIDELFERWVQKGGAEGLVVRSDTAGTFKIKPWHTLDLAVLGFTESLGERQGLLHDLLLGVMRHDGTLQVLSRVGGGFSEDQRRTILCDLKDMVVESEYAEVNADHVAYQMVQPDWVVEVNCLDLVSQTTRGGPINRMVLDYSKNGSDGYHVVCRLPLAAIISPQFVRRREDKSVRPEDIRIEQVSNLVDVPLVDRDARHMTLPTSEVLRREVYTKQLKGETMVRKFVMWKSNKETASDEYPAFVVHYTDFSPNRKAPLAREVRVSNSQQQIAALWDELKDANIKKGWEMHSAINVESPTAGVAAASQQAAPVPVETTATTKKTAAKKKPKKKLAPSAREKKKPAKKKSG